MKTAKPLLALTFSGLVLGLVGCSKSDSPTAPKPKPTPQAVSLSLTVSASQAVAGEYVEARATVSQGSSPVADGTAVNFTLPEQLCWFDRNNNGQQDEGETGLCHWFAENNAARITKQTTGGVASAAWTSGTNGEVEVSAAVGSANAKRTVRFFAGESPTDLPRFFAVDPAFGSARGGYSVTISGQWLCKAYLNGSCAVPGDVVMRQAFVVGSDVIVGSGGGLVIVENSVDREVALPVVSFTGNGTQDSIVVTIPEADSGYLFQNAKVTLTINNGVGAVEAASVFEYLADFLVVGQPQIFEVTPSQGSARGGEEVLITGENLCVVLDSATHQCVARFLPAVRFDPPNAPAEVTWASPDGRALRVKTPLASAEPLSENLLAALVVNNLTGTGTRPDAFVFVAETPVPKLTALMPNAGPIEGGTRVTIFGSGFQAPVQVLFGDRQAQVISSNYNEVVCIAPSIAPSAPSTPTVVNVTVTNILTGKTSANALPYRYGEAMFVSGIRPAEGYIGGWTSATIYGQGFVAPVQVLVTVGDITKEAQVISVAGTEIQVMMPPFTEVIGDECTPTVATFTVTNLGSNLIASGPTFTYLCSPPLSGV